MKATRSQRKIKETHRAKKPKRKVVNGIPITGRLLRRFLHPERRTVPLTCEGACDLVPPCGWASLPPNRGWVRDESIA